MARTNRAPAAALTPEQARKRELKRRARMTWMEVYKLIRAGSIGELERLAGVEDRAAFWWEFRLINPPGKALDAGVAQLKDKILARYRRGEIDLP